MNNKVLYIIASLILLLSAYSCVDDRLYDPDEYGEGMATVTAEISFDDLTPALTRAVEGGTMGTAIDTIYDVTILIYKLDGSILTDDNGKPLRYYSRNVSVSMESDASAIMKVTLPNIPYGKYKMYAIANVPNDLLTDDLIKDINNVKNLQFRWDENDIAANKQMFGYFSDDKSHNGFDAPAVAIKSPNPKIHAWVKRMASKVTVAFDARNLNDSIYIYLLSATIKDIPTHCYLGRNNTPSSSDSLISEGQTIMYVNDPEGRPYDETWSARISRHNPIFGFNTEALQNTTLTPKEKLAAQHEESVNAFFFYENMQGKGEAGTASDKWQVVEGNEDKTKPSYPNGNNPDSIAYKDTKKFGTYIEVEAYYISNNPKDISRGKIKYRFMLGKDDHTDFNAERNHHFKLTLCFNGYANDVDWHIDFDQTPEIVGPTPCNISYLYNQPMDYTFTVVGGKLKKLTAQIPDNDITKGSWHPQNGEVTPEDEQAASSVGGSVYWTGTVQDEGPWNGFLSLRRTTEAEYGSISEGYTPDNSATYSLNKVKFYGSSSYNPTDNSVNNLGYREYGTLKDGYIEAKDYTDIAGNYSIKNTAPGVWTIKLPLFTRPRVMTAQTGYSGNNPYVAYNRLSQVVFSATLERTNGSDTTVFKTIDVKQARRVVNPKAVWRDASSVAPFHVKLKIRESQTSLSFSNLISDGPWKAEVVCGDWIQLIATPNASDLRDGIIYGHGNPYDSENIAGRTIDFSFSPNGTTSTPRGGIIRITYDNYSCVHNIFVRQGYDPVEFYGSGTMWHSFNLKTGGNGSTVAEEVAKPQYEGSYFRKYNRQYPIDASSNTARTPFQVVNGMDKFFKIAGSNESKKWETIKTSSTSWGIFKVILKEEEITCRIPSKADWDNIIHNKRTIYGYGVLYGDNASETKDAITEAYGADPINPNSGYGMRGVIVCDSVTGTQIFLPIAASGYGRIKQQFPKKWTADGKLITNELRLEPGYGGVVQYANRFTWFTSTGGYRGITYKPLFYDLFSSQGALYWLDNDYALDINYVTLGFSVGLDDPNGVAVIWGWPQDPSGTDAIHLRLVHDKPKPSTPEGSDNTGSTGNQESSRRSPKIDKVKQKLKK